jgi:hypothetical protein
LTNKGKKLEPPLKLDVSFGEALERFVGTLPKEVDASIERAKTKKPSQDGTQRRPPRPIRRSSGGED